MLQNIYKLVPKECEIYKEQLNEKTYEDILGWQIVIAKKDFNIGDLVVL